MLPCSLIFVFFCINRGFVSCSPETRSTTYSSLRSSYNRPSDTQSHSYVSSNRPISAYGSSSQNNRRKQAYGNFQTSAYQLDGGKKPIYGYDSGYHSPGTTATSTHIYRPVMEHDEDDEEDPDDEDDESDEEDDEEVVPSELDEVHPTPADCWWTKCQPLKIVKGCQQYNRTEASRVSCSKGYKFQCCQYKPYTTSTRLPSKQKKTTLPTTSAGECWWTGCQPNDWAAVGCDQYDRIEEERKECANGFEYKCCKGQKTAPVVSTSTDSECWWTGCQQSDWADVGCDQYQKVEVARKECRNGHEFKCCNGEKKVAKKPNSGLFEECLWSACFHKNISSVNCPAGYEKNRQQICENGGTTFECCGKPSVEPGNGENTDSLTGQSYEDLVKYLFTRDKDFAAEPDSLKCKAVEDGKKHYVKFQNKAFKMCDFCPNLPQKHLLDMYLNRVPSKTEENIEFGECFGLCYLDKKCVALSYNRDDSVCYMFDSTAGKYEEQEGWNTVLMTQPSSVIQDWIVTRHTRLLGYIYQSSMQRSFLNCLDNCKRLKRCNYVSYSFHNKNCSMYENSDDVVYSDLVYGYVAGVRSSMTIRAPSERFQHEGDDIAVAPRKKFSGKCKKFFNGTHGATFNQGCLTGGSDLLGCDQSTGCILCYFPENSSSKQYLTVCQESETNRLKEAKELIRNTLKKCLKEGVCIGVGYDSRTGESSTMDWRAYLKKTYNTTFMLKQPPEDTSRKYLGEYDIMPNSQVKQISKSATKWKQVKGKTLEQCLELFGKESQFSRASYSFSTRTCKLTTETSGLTRKLSLQSITVFRKPSLLSPTLTYVRMPGYAITYAKPKARLQNCVDDCEEQCSEMCSQKYGTWCAYISLEVKDENSLCQFYDDETDFSFKAIENAMILTRVSATNFTLDSLNKWRNFQGYDLFNCFKQMNRQTQTSLAVYNRTDADEDSSEDGDGDDVRSRRIRRNAVGDFFSGLASDAWDGLKQVGQAALDTGKNVIDTGINLAKGDLEAAGESFLNIPVVDLAKNTGELGLGVVTGDWDKVKEKGLEILESDGFALVTSIGIPGGGGVIAQGVKQGIKAGTKNLFKRAGKNLVQEGVDHLDDIARRASRSIKGRKKTPKKSKKGNKKKDRDSKKKEEVDKERGVKCENNNRQKRARWRFPKKKPGKSCKEQKTSVCKKPLNIKNSLEDSLNNCKGKKLGRKCEYECRPGFKETRLPINCVSANQRAVWKPIPKCTPEDCPEGNSPLIIVQTPQKSNLGSVGGGQHITAYVVLFNKPRKLPYWSVALHQSKQFKSNNYNAQKGFARLQHFTLHPCRQLKGKQAGGTVYTNTKWDRGHLTPASVARWSEKAARSSNLFINIAPQDPFTNQQPWKLLEGHVECFSKKFRSIVATGICPGKIATSGNGRSKADVPECFWKMICYQDERRNYQVVGFYSDNSHPVGEDEEGIRSAQVLTPLSQTELLRRVPGGFNNVWIKAGPHLQSARQVAMSGGVWFPVNAYQCSLANTLSQQERDGWRSAFDKQAHYLKRGKNVKKDGATDDVESDVNSASEGENRRKRQTTSGENIQRGCHGSDLKSYLDMLGFFTSLKAQDDEEEIDDGTENQEYEDDEEEEDEDEYEDSEEEKDDDEGDGSVKVSTQKCGKRIVGYYTSWGNKTIAGLELQRLTHVIFAFLEMKEDGSILIGTPDRKNSLDANAETEKARERMENLLESAKRYPHLKVMFAVGGWENSQYFSNVAASPQKRLFFISSIIKVIDKFGFDGVDIDWEYPVTGGANEGVSSDKQNYVQLMKELRAALDNLASEAGRKGSFLISFAGAAGQWTLDPGYDLPGLFKYVDFVNIMTYDYFGAWASKWGSYTGPPSPLYFGMPVGFSGKTNSDWTVKYYTCKTNQPHKINMGVPFYGRYWKNVGNSVDGKDEMWRKAAAVNGEFVGGYVPWYEVKADYLKNSAFQKRYHEKSQTPYAWNPQQKIFLGYENEKSLKAKVKYAAEKNIGGLMIWALELDDDDLTLLDIVAAAPLCQKTDPKLINFKCSPIDEKRWWTPEDGDGKEGLCGRSAPLYKGYYPVCDPDDPGYSCCGAQGYCGKGPQFCDCPTCKNYASDPRKILQAPIKPTIPVTWYLLNDPDGKRGRCGRKIPKIGSFYPTCNPDDPNSYCCSNGGYCGNTDEHCKCDGCINFKENPKYKFGPKKWWTLEDGKDLGGRCGPDAPKVDGIYEAECEGTSKFHCCSPTGWCGSGPQFCTCDGCKDFRST